MYHYPNDFIIGVLKEYDEQGNLTSEKDMDKPYTYTWKNVKEYLQKHGVTDIKSQVIKIVRHHNKKTTIWKLDFNGTYNTNSGRYAITLDGKTGEEIEVKLFKGKKASGKKRTIADYQILLKKETTKKLKTLHAKFL